MFKLFEFFKKEEPQPEVPAETPKIPDEIDLRFELAEINKACDSYIRICQRNLKIHTEKYVEYKRKNAVGHDFAKDELVRILANRKCMENAQHFKDTMGQKFEEYKRGIMNVQLMEDMAEFANSIKYTVGEMGGNVDSLGTVKTISEAGAAIDRVQTQLNDAMSLFESASFESASDYMDEATSDIEQTLENIIKMETKFSDTPVSNEDITKKIMEKLV